ncbi:8655_t:CDS:1, partial [Gigaspora margarita]
SEILNEIVQLIFTTMVLSQYIGSKPEEVIYKGDQKSTSTMLNNEPENVTFYLSIVL